MLSNLNNDKKKMYTKNSYLIQKLNYPKIAEFQSPIFWRSIIENEDKN